MQKHFFMIFFFKETAKRVNAEPRTQNKIILLLLNIKKTKPDEIEKKNNNSLYDLNLNVIGLKNCRE